MKNNIIVADTNVILNFLKIDRIDLIQKHSHDFILTDHVIDEVGSEKFDKQKDILLESIDKGIFSQVSLISMEVIEIFKDLESKGMLGLGECSAIAYAIHHNYDLAIDDKVAIKHAKLIANKFGLDLRILTTQDLMISMINENILSFEEADNIKTIWETKHRFKLKIDSFKNIGLTK